MVKFGGVEYNDQTTSGVIDALDRARFNNERIRIFYGDAATGKAWSEENDVIGFVRVSHSKAPLLFYHEWSEYGSMILEQCIVKIITKKGTLYKHLTFQTAKYAIGPRVESLPVEYRVSVYADGVNIANFRTEKQAQRWIDFMTGKRFLK